MTVRATWAIVECDRKNSIYFIEDICNKTGQMSITNDAENVLRYVQEAFGRSWRVVYKDTDQTWWEIFWQADGLWQSDFSVAFKKWEGMAWDILQRTAL